MANTDIAIKYKGGSEDSRKLMDMVWAAWTKEQFGRYRHPTLKLIRRMWKNDRAIALRLRESTYTEICLRFL